MANRDCKEMALLAYSLIFRSVIVKAVQTMAEANSIIAINSRIFNMNSCLCLSSSFEFGLTNPYKKRAPSFCANFAFRIKVCNKLISGIAEGAL